MSKPHLRLTARADQNLRDQFSAVAWEKGMTAADRYASEIRTILDTLTKKPKLGRKISHIRKGVRLHEHEGYMIFYRVDEDDMLVLAVEQKSRSPLV